MEKLISIIIPTYNMEDFILKALESLVIRRNLDALNVLVINDGSKDRSSELAHSFADKYPHSFRVIDKENGNYGSCINEGLRHAVGKYVKVLDADDWFDTENFDRMVEMLKHVDVDLVVSHFAKVDASGHVGDVRDLHIPSGQTLDMDTLSRKRSVQGLWMHEIAYRRENVIRMGYHQEEGISYTDVQWGFSPMAMVKTVFFTGLLVYYYRVGREGQSMDVNVYRRQFAQEFRCTSAMLADFVGMKAVSQAVEQMMADKMRGRIIALYKRALVDMDDRHNEAMIAFDELLKAKSPALYKAVGCRLLSVPLFCYPYIGAWRKNRDGRLLQLVLRLYRRYKR